MNASASVRSFSRFMAGSTFALLLMGALGSGALLMAVLAFIPPSGTAMDAFAENFRLWCFGLDPATGKMEWAAVLVWVTSPLLMVLVTAGVYAQPLAAGWREKRWASLWPFIPATLLVVGTCAGVALAAEENPYAANQPLPFPAEGLRTKVPAPAFSLTNQDGQRVTLDSLRGRVLMLTGVYAHCYHACPIILTQARLVMDSLTEEERRSVTVVAVTLDPERDTPGGFKELGERHKVGAPTFQLLTGEPAPVNALLDRLGIERKKDEATGQIDHANLFLVVDRYGMIAYRFGATGPQSRWVSDALHLLVAEHGPTS